MRDAEYMMGYLWRYEDGLEHNNTIVFEWYLRASQKGHPESPGEVGYMYYAGACVVQDYAKGAEWYLKSAENGIDFAQYSIGYLYLQGEGVEQNDKKAIYWFRKSVAQGYERSKVHLFELPYEGKGGESAYPEDFKLPSELLETDTENDEYQYMTALMYLEGLGVTANPQMAFVWMEKAAENENIDAQYELSDMYYLGIGVEQDPAKGNYWLDAAEENEYWWYYGY